MVTHIYFAVLRKVAISKYVSTAQSTKFPLKKDFFYECEPISRLLTKENLVIVRGESRAAATSKMECFVIIVNGWKPLTIITKYSILDVAAVLDPPLIAVNTYKGTFPSLYVVPEKVLPFH